MTGAKIPFLADDADPFLDEHEPLCKDCDKMLVEIEEIDIGFCQACLSEREFKHWERMICEEHDCIEMINTFIEQFSPLLPVDSLDQWNQIRTHCLEIFNRKINKSKDYLRLC